MIAPAITALSQRAPAPLDPHQAHMAHQQHLTNVPQPVSAHQNHLNVLANQHAAHMQHLKTIGQDPNAINKYLTNDTTYQSQTSAINKALGDYSAQELNQENSYNSGYALNRSDLAEQQRLGGINQDEDYGSRGMVRSGLYANDKVDFLNQYARQNSNLDQQRNDYMLNLHQGLNNYTSSQQLALQQAKQDAINRRAIGLIGQTPTGG